MLKAAEVELLLARTICSGKYLVVVAGDVASVQASMEAGENAVHDGLIESRVIPRLHPSVFPAISQSVDDRPGERPGPRRRRDLLGGRHRRSAADAAAKAAAVTLYRIHLAMAIGGKGFLLMTGDVASVKAGVEAGRPGRGLRGNARQQGGHPRADAPALPREPVELGREPVGRGEPAASERPALVPRTPWYGYGAEVPALRLAPP